MKKFFILLIVLSLFCFTACTNQNPDDDKRGTEDVVEITLGTFPIGNWGDMANLSSLLAAFHRDNPQINVTVNPYDYVNGDKDIEEAIENGTLPDIIFEGPERLVVNWGARGLMEDISDLLDEEHTADIDPAVMSACHDKNGKYYIYPLCRTTHCMAINYDMFEAADALKYIDEETHTWTTSGFENAVKALRTSGVERVAAIFCGGQGGDQGTRALVTNLFGGTFTNDAHTEYTVNCPENVEALEFLRELDGVDFYPDIVGSDEINKFIGGELAMAFCWNGAQELTAIKDGKLDFDVFPMAFPTNMDSPQLQGGIWGFGVFKGKDEKHIAAAKTFIEYMTENEDAFVRAVRTSSYWPVKNIEDFYQNDTLMTEYGIFQKYFGDYYQITTNWANARTAWWNMLREVGEGADVAKALEKMQNIANSKQFDLTCNDPEGYLIENLNSRYVLGERIVVKTKTLPEEDLICYVNGRYLDSQTPVFDGDDLHWEFYFEMPAENVTITFLKSTEKNLVFDSAVIREIKQKYIELYSDKNLTESDIYLRCYADFEDTFVFIPTVKGINCERIVTYEKANDIAFVFPVKETFAVYKDGELYDFATATAEGLLTDEQIKTLYFNHRSHHYALYYTLGIVKISQRVTAEIIASYIEKNAERNLTESDVSLSCYGAFENAYALFIFDRSDYSNVITREFVDGLEFVYSVDNKLQVYYQGDFFSLSEAFQRNILSRDDLLAVWNNYRAGYLYLY